jgi:very-short-patch-repair endonuclease
VSAPNADSKEQFTRPGSGLQEALGKARQQLLDLGLRNNLLNYRLLKSRGIDAETTQPDELIDALVSGRQIRFVARPPEVDETNGVESPRAQSTSPTTLEIPVEDAEIDRRLLNTHDHARISLEEQGLNTLFLAFGMLEWYEDDSSSRARYAPLVLVPVELTRRDAMIRFVVTFSGEEIGGNLSLEAKMESDFGLKLPSFDPENGLLTEYFAEIERAVQPLSRWRVDPSRVVLGHFSFNKFLMYRDLDFEAWPSEAHPLSHPIIQGLLSSDGFRPEPSNYDEDQFLDDVLSDADHPMVVDADSSQTLALLDALDGRTMVIQGPPGTGKSQTITNLLALAIGQGKRVLFVAEKMAALEVVKRRLDQLGLGVACLELHGTKTRKRRVLDDLHTTISLGAPQSGNHHEIVTRLRDARTQLNDYCRALSEPVDSTGITPYTALGEIVRIRDTQPTDQWPRIQLQNVASWTSDQLHERLAMVADLQQSRAEVGDPSAHPYTGVRRTSISPVEMEDLRLAMQDALDRLAKVAALNEQVWSRLDQGVKESPAAIETAVETGRRAATANAQGEIRYANPKWFEQSDVIEALLDDGAAASALYQQHHEAMTDDTWEMNLDGLLTTMGKYRSSPIRWLSRTYWQNRSQVNSFFTDAGPADLWGRVDVLGEVQRYQQLRASLAERDALGSELFGSHWRGLDSDWSHLQRLHSSARALHRDIRDQGLTSALLDVLDAGIDRNALSRLADELGQAAIDAREAVRDVCGEVQFNEAEHHASGVPIDQWSVAEQRALLERWLQHLPSLNQWVNFRRALLACHENGLDSVAERAWTWERAGEELEDVFLYRVYLSIFDHAWRSRTALGNAGNMDKDRIRDQFRDLDRAQLRWNQALLARKHWEQLPRNGGGEVRVLATEIQKKRRNLPIRQLMKQAGNAIQAIKPVFMMSPLSVANFLPPGAIEFDLVVFDEASQVEPVDAFGAILRGRQAIVVGDDRQLPPTDFFQRSIEEDELDDPSLVSPGDMQSILNLFIAQAAPERMLRWHYRSQHESLIAVSNQEFYDNRLVVFPSPSHDSGDLGLRLHHLPETVYDRGRSRVNREEAKAVAQAVMEHAIEQPQLTLGVAAFSKAQADAIRDELEVLRRDRPVTESFFNEDVAEPFFIKSLENVQGDERDVIFISVGYGRDENGRVTNNFGPVNNEGGERRLNVLITRSRRRCEVFTNISDEDIPATAASQGVQALRTFLHYARTNEFPAATHAGDEPQSPFEMAVHAALEGAGYTVHTQVGSAGYFIDLAVVDPDRPGRYLLAIECDGATFHSSRSARDRDRLRQQVLEGLGWKFHRIWSTDWFHDPQRELQQVMTAIEEARQYQTATPNSSSVMSRDVPPLERDPNGLVIEIDDELELPPYTVAQLSFPPFGGDFDRVSEQQLADALISTIDVEGPVSIEILYRRVAEAIGVRRLTQRIRGGMGLVLKALESRGRIEIRQEFVWPASMSTPPMRSRAELDGLERDLEHVAPEEIDAVILAVVDRSFSISRTESTRIVARSLGLQRVGQNAETIVQARISHLLETQRLTEQDDILRPPANG